MSSPVPQNPTSTSRNSLVIERHYVPRSAPRYSTRTNQTTGPAGNTSRSSGYDEQPSPAISSINSHSPNGYMADYSVSEISSLAGSVSSMPMRQHLDPSKLTHTNRYQPESGDSGMFSGRAREYIGSTTSYAETDIDSVAGDSESRYREELFQPKAAPRIIQREVRQMYGEVHPKNLPSEELPTPSSGDELETMSEASIPSFTDVPRARPRASLRRKKLAALNTGFVSDDESIASQSERSKSLPRGILKTNGTDISDAESLATSGSNFRRTASGRTVRFQHNDKSKTIVKKGIDYEKIDSADSGSKKRKTSSNSDPFSVIKPMGIKPARNDPKRSSGRSSQRGRQARSSSKDRSRSPSRQGSLRRGRPGSGKERSSSAEGRKKSSAERSKMGSPVSGEDVRVEMPNEPSAKPKPRSVIQELSRSKSSSVPRMERRDNAKIVKWCLIIGVPSVILVVVIIAIAIAFTGG